MADWVDLETAIQTAEEPEMHEFYEKMFENGGEHNPVSPFSPFSAEALDNLFADLYNPDEEIAGQGKLNDIGDDDMSL